MAAPSIAEKLEANERALRALSASQIFMPQSVDVEDVHVPVAPAEAAATAERLAQAQAEKRGLEALSDQSAKQWTQALENQQAMARTAQADIQSRLEAAEVRSVHAREAACAPITRAALTTPRSVPA